MDPPPYWKMSRFSKVKKFSIIVTQAIITHFQIPAKLQTFRTDKEKAVAFVNHASDSTSRTGIFGHGIYTAAKS